MFIGSAHKLAERVELPVAVGLAFVEPLELLGGGVEAEQQLDATRLHGSESVS